MRRKRTLTAMLAAAGVVLLHALPAASGQPRNERAVRAQRRGAGSSTLNATLTLSAPVGPVCLGTKVTFTATHSCSTIGIVLTVAGGDPVDPPKKTEKSGVAGVSVTVKATTPGLEKLVAVARSADDLEVTLAVTVVKVTFDKERVEVQVGDTATLFAEITPSEEALAVFFTVDKVNGGIVTATVSPTQATASPQELTISGIRPGLTVMPKICWTRHRRRTNRLRQ